MCDIKKFEKDPVLKLLVVDGDEKKIIEHLMEKYKLTYDESIKIIPELKKAFVGGSPEIAEKFFKVYESIKLRIGSKVLLKKEIVSQDRRIIPKLSVVEVTDITRDGVEIESIDGEVAIIKKDKIDEYIEMRTK